MKRSGPIVVIGSINMDLVCRTPRMPAAGETIIGSDFVTVPGGKGANQAVAAAKLGGDVHMVGRVGADDFGERLRAGLDTHRVNIEHVTTTAGAPSGCAIIVVDRKGENSIVVVPGANHRVTPADVDAARDLISSAAAVVLQLEIPLQTVRHVVALCQVLDVPTLLDPAPVPARGLPRAVYGVDVLTPNQGEAELLLGLEPSHKVKVKRVPDPKQVATDLLARGPKSVVLKLGSRGAMIVERGGAGIELVKAFKAKVVDTTAAGDAFTGALAVARAEGVALSEAVRFANAAGALCCQGFGAQPSLPSRAEVDALIRSS